VSALPRLLDTIDRDELVELTRALVRLPSVYRPGDPDANESRVAAFVEGWLRREGFQVEVQPVEPGRPNVVGWLGEKRPGRRSLLLEGHTDVVTEGDPSAWTWPPFGADLVDGRIYGRGSADMKSGLAAAMVAAAAIRRSGVRLGGRLVVGALVDEEGGMMGARHLCTTALGRELSAAIICEPEENELCLEQRGVVWARVTVRGRMAHGAMPEAGLNPITALGALLREAPALERRLRRLCRRSPYLRPPTVTPTVARAPMQGVPQSNVIPSTAQATLDVRLTPGPDADTVAKEIDVACQRAMDACPGTTVEWEPINGFRLATRVERGEPLVHAMVRGVRQATGRAPRFGGVPGSTDGTILRTTLGIPIVTCGPGNRLIPHQVDEYVEVAELVDAAKIYVASALKFLEP
jgi:succinyl-diaminopimelate desuccinylase